MDSKKVKQAVQDETKQWIPEAEILEVTPLRMVVPDDDDVMPVTPTESDST